MILSSQSSVKINSSNPFLISPSIRQFFCEFTRIQVYRTCLIIDLKTCPKMASKGLETDVSNRHTLCSIPKQNLSQTDCCSPTAVAGGISELRCCNIQSAPKYIQLQLFFLPFKYFQIRLKDTVVPFMKYISPPICCHECICRL